MSNENATEQTKRVDDEFTAMDACVKALKSLPHDTQRRVMNYLTSRFASAFPGAMQR